MSGSSAYVIAGAGLAGAKAAETLREEGFDGPVVLIGDETERPYERPPLSKDYLLGKAERDTIYVHPASWYADNGVELRLGVPVTGIDRAAHEVALADGYAANVEIASAEPQPVELPAGLDAPTNISDGGTFSAAIGVITWHFASLPDGAKVLTYQAAVSQDDKNGDVLTNVAVVTSPNTQCPANVDSCTGVGAA